MVTSLRTSNEHRPQLEHLIGPACTDGEHICLCSLQARSLSLRGWGLIDLLLRATFSPAHPLARRDVPLARERAFQSSSLLVEGVAEAALYCAHRTSTVSPCAFCEQEGHLAAPSPSFRGRALREHRGSSGSIPSSAPGVRDQHGCRSHSLFLRARRTVWLLPSHHFIRLTHLNRRRVVQYRSVV